MVLGSRAMIYGSGFRCIALCVKISKVRDGCSKVEGYSQSANLSTLLSRAIFSSAFFFNRGP